MASLPVVALSLTLAVAPDVSGVQQQATILGLTVEAAEFSDFERVLGPAQVRHNGGDAASSAYFACYVGPDGTALVIESKGEMGGGVTINAFQLLANVKTADFSGMERFTPPRSGKPKCARTRKLARAISTGGGLRLGMTRDEVVQSIRMKVSAISGSAQSALFFYMEDDERPVPDVDGGFIGKPRARITVDLERERVVGIRVAYSSVI